MNRSRGSWVTWQWKINYRHSVTLNVRPTSVCFPCLATTTDLLFSEIYHFYVGMDHSCVCARHCSFHAATENIAMQLEFDVLTREHRTLQTEVSQMNLDKTIYDFKLHQHSDRLDRSLFAVVLP